MRKLGAALTAGLLLLAGCGVRAQARTEAGPRVLSRVVQLARGKDRPLPTTVWYLSGPDGTGMAAGKHPIVLFSHGLGGLPEQFAPLAGGWAEAGYVVAAPAYPHTNGHVRHVDAGDIGRQPADAAYVLKEITTGELAAHLDAGHVAAVGFSAGATTTLGLLRAGHSRSLRAAVSIAGRRPSTAFGGPATPILFLHGDEDPVVPIEAGRAAFDAVPWPKQFIPVRGAGHGQYLNPGHPDYPATSARILEFLEKHVPTQ
ncbi:alpha/beta hydrolase family protein [Actinoplanes sp. HUAS TT8]|uniref:alpha/beta hydrolase family protein n=1 Tax=Actinoplanes sp. HUAS TT8 TaxID=3447453 RepID=UPI003F52342F